MSGHRPRSDRPRCVVYRSDADLDGLDPGDAAEVRKFAAFLRDPTSRCAICLDEGHSAANCPEVHP